MMPQEFKGLKSQVTGQEGYIDWLELAKAEEFMEAIRRTRERIEKGMTTEETIKPTNTTAVDCQLQG